MTLTGCSSSSTHKTAGTSSSPSKVSYREASFQKNEIPWDFQPGEIPTLCREFIRHTDSQLQTLAKVPADQRSLETTLAPMERALMDFDQFTAPLQFMQSVHLSEKIRKESLECEQKIQAFFVDVGTRKELYEAVNRVSVTTEADFRLKSETVKSFEKNGLKLSPEKLAQFKKLQQQLAKLSSEFSFNIADDKTQLSFSESELEGATPDFLARLKKDKNGKFIVRTTTPDYLAVNENVRVSETRRRMLLAYNNRAAQKNIPLLKKILHLRQDMATLMGFPTWADYRTSEGRMATSAKEVWDFLNALKSKLALGKDKDLKLLSEFKKKLDPQDGKLQPWDTLYYAYQYKKRNYNLDDDVIRPYFPSDRVVEKMFKIYSSLLGVSFQKVNTVTWSPDVNYYKIIDNQTKNEIAYFYADFIPREGKYNHAAAFSLRSGRLLPDGSYSKPISAIVANFTPSAAGKPALLNHDEVETLFHEFGHIMHQTLTRAPYGSLAGTSVARDFVEAPSQMLENWVWSKDMLTRLSGHVDNDNKKLPVNLRNKIIDARNFLLSNFYTRQLWLGILDMTYHSNPPKDMDTSLVQQQLYKDIVGLDPVPESRFEAGFGHLMGYDAGYYGYLWSEVYAADMFTRFEAAGLLSPKMGARYRKEILEPGNMRDAKDLIRSFLGREPSQKPFYRKLGLKI